MRGAAGARASRHPLSTLCEYPAPLMLIVSQQDTLRTHKSGRVKNLEHLERAVINLTSSAQKKVFGGPIAQKKKHPRRRTGARTSSPPLLHVCTYMAHADGKSHARGESAQPARTWDALFVHAETVARAADKSQEGEPSVIEASLDTTARWTPGRCKHCFVNQATEELACRCRCRA